MSLQEMMCEIAYLCEEIKKLDKKTEKPDYSKMGPFSAMDKGVNDFFNKTDVFIERLKEQQKKKK